MRNQTWNSQGQLLEDKEITRIGMMAVVIDHLAGTQRPATSEETKELMAQERQAKIAEARERALAAIKANAGSSPWGAILKDLAIAQEWLNEQGA